MPSAISQNANVYTDLSSLTALKGEIKSGGNDAIEKVAKQFEAIFLQMMLSGMRKTIQVNEEFSNDKSMYYDLFDKQVAMNLSDKGGIGLARMMMTQGDMGTGAIQKKGQLPVTPEIRATVIQDDFSNKNKVLQSTNIDHKEVSSAESDKLPLNFDSPLEFIQTIWNVAKDVLQESGLNPKAVLAQAALETGWGKHIMKTVGGESSYNLFGIKSGRQWQGEQAMANTLEYKNGVMVKSREGFRSYESIKESVQDYVDFLKTNQRYGNALKQAADPDAYVVELQKAGYATDPQYANKIKSIMDRPEFTQLFDGNRVRDI